MKKKIITITSVLCSVLIVLAMSAIIALVYKPNNAYAEETPNLVITKTPTVTVYVTGENVRLVESTLAEDKYIVEGDKTVTLYAVNESKIFTNWSVAVDDVATPSTSTKNPYSLSVDKNTTVEAMRTDPLGTDRGKYMYNKFIISDASHLIAIQKMIANGITVESSDTELIGYYDIFFATYPGYEELTTNAEKAAFITSEKFHTIIQYGYYFVEGNIALMDPSFTGIGTDEYPFRGVFCGDNDGNYSTIITTITTKEKEGNSYYGLFGVLDNQAVIRNLKISTSVGLSENPAVTDGKVYIGGVAGYINNALLYNLEVKSVMSADIVGTHVHAGGIAGYFTGGISSINKIKYNGFDTSWGLTVTANSSKHIYSGYVAGAVKMDKVEDAKKDGYPKVQDVSTPKLYFKGIEIDVTAASANINSESGDAASGNLIGYLYANDSVEIDDIVIINEENATIQNTINKGDNIVGGLIGYVEATADGGSVSVGKITFTSIGATHNLIAQTTDASSEANVYCGGLFGKVDCILSNDGKGNVYGNETFRSGAKNIDIDDQIILVKDYIFNGNFNIKTIQNGKGDPGTYTIGKSICGGLVGKGLFDINGNVVNSSGEEVSFNPGATIDENTYTINTSKILLCDGGKFEVSAIQSATSSVKDSENYAGDYEHCIASMVFGLLSDDDDYDDYDFNYIDVYANNAYVTATREIGSKAIGDLRVSGFIGYIEEISVDRLNLFVNSSVYDLQSLSYEMKNTKPDSNNAYCGGVIAQAKGEDGHTVSTVGLYNITLSGYNTNTLAQIGTTLKMNSIQNTQAGGGDTKGDNYTGGIVAQINNVLIVSGCKYIGSETKDDEIIMQGHQNPDSSFCGGIIGFLWDNRDTTQTYRVVDCEVQNATIKGYATTARNTDYSNPDLYVSGVIGASYHNGNSNVESFEKLRLFNSEVYGIANERIETFVAGINGAITWGSGNQNFSDCYVFGSIISATSSSTGNINFDNAYAAGICAHNTGTSSKISNCAVIDSKVIATSKYGKAYAGGIADKYTWGYTLDNNYTNSSVLSSGSTASQAYKFVANEDTYGDGAYGNNYYTSNTSGLINSSYYQYSVELDDYEVTSSKNFSLVDNNYKGNKFWPILSQGSNSNFKLTNVGTTSNVTIAPIANADSNASDLVDLWINAKSNGDTNGPESYATALDAHRAGWFCLGTIVVHNGTDTGTIDGIDTLDTTYIDDYGYRYKYDLSSTDDERYLHHETYTSYKIQSGFIESDLNTAFNGYNILKEYDINLYDNMPYLEMIFSINNRSVYHMELLNESGTVITSSTELSKIGSLTLTSETIKDGSNYSTDYKIVYVPNESPDTLNPYTFYIRFKVGSGSLYEENIFKFVVTPNVKTLVAVETATYTPALNYTEEGLGTIDNPYIFRQGSTVKFIPVFTKSNDFTHTLYNSDTNIEYVNYTLNNSDAGTMKSSGELIIGSTYTTDASDNTRSEKYSVTISIKDGEGIGEDVTVYFAIAVDDFTVSVSSTGAEINGLTYGSTTTDYYFTLRKYSNYSGIPESFTITINGVEHDLKTTSGLSNFVVNGKTKDVFKENIADYNIKIPASLIKTNMGNSTTGNIEIHIEMVVIYEVTLVINNESFFPGFTREKEMTFYIPSGHTLHNYFYETGKLDTDGESLEIKQIKTWVESGTIYGYTFNGFYLVEDASSLNSYGKRFEEICTDADYNMQISTNITFYGSWSFLIELIEAPGTTIKTSFPDTFMREYDDYQYVHNMIKIPINNNRGYVFTIEKDENFYGEASVKAYSVTQSSGENIIEEIVVEKYHDNMYLYFIAPEKIHGYLVVQTSSTNSEIIVGENTAKVSEEVIPADGVYTFKYAVNHVNLNGEKSYIYNYISKDNTLVKDFVIKFYKQTYDPNEKYAVFTSSDGYLKLNMKKGEVGQTFNGETPTYYLIMHDATENNSQIISQEIVDGIKSVQLVFDQGLIYKNGSVDQKMFDGMKVYGKVSLNDANWTEISGTNKVYQSLNTYDTIVYNFDTNLSYKYFMIDNVTGSTQHIHKFAVVDGEGTQHLLDLDSELDPNDSNNKLDRTYEFVDGFKLSNRELKIGTVIEVYYYKYVQGVKQKSVVASYEVETEGISSIKLSDFVLFDDVTKPFATLEKFSDFLGNAEGVISEVYYFSITPINGLDFDEIDETNYIIHSGYVDASGEYIVADKTTNIDIDNKPLVGDFGSQFTKDTSLQERVYNVTHSRDTYLSFVENDGDPYYTFTDVTDYHAYSLDVFGAKIPNSGVLPEILSLYNDIGYDTYLESNKLEFYIGNISFTAFSERDGLINVYGSIGTDEFGVDIWSSAFSIEVEALVEKEYVLDVREYDFVKYRIDSESNYEIQLKDLTITDKVTGIDFNADFSKIGYVINDNVITYDIRKEIIGDTRHDGKKFVLALQLVTSDDDEITTSDKVLSSIPTDVYILVNGNKVYPNDSSATGRNVIYFNLSSLLSEGVDEYSFTIENIPSGYHLVLQLLEVTNAQKPAMGEVRCQIIDGEHIPFKPGMADDHE